MFRESATVGLNPIPNSCPMVSLKRSTSVDDAICGGLETGVPCPQQSMQTFNSAHQISFECGNHCTAHSCILVARESSDIGSKREMGFTSEFRNYLWQVGCMKLAAAATHPVGSTFPTTSVHALACLSVSSPSIPLLTAPEMPVGSMEV